MGQSSGKRGSKYCQSWELFATITFTETSLTVVNPNGDPLSDREEQVLREIMDFVDEVFDVWEDLFNPVEFLFSF